MKKYAKKILTLLFIISILCTVTVQVIGKPIETSEQINSKEIAPEGRNIRRWLVFGIGGFGVELPHGRYFKPAGQIGFKGVTGSLTWYIDLNDISDFGPIYSGVIWKNARPTEKLHCVFIGHMGLTTILGIYTVFIN